MGGILTSLRRIVQGGLTLVENRVELFAVELREEKCRLVEAIILALASVIFGMMSLIFFTLLIVTLFWNNGRVAVLLTVSLLYLLGTFLAGYRLRGRLKKSRPFSGTLGEIEKDRACFGSEN